VQAGGHRASSGAWCRPLFFDTASQNPRNLIPQWPVTASSRSNPHPPQSQSARHRNYRCVDGVVSIPAHRIGSHVPRAVHRHFSSGGGRQRAVGQEQRGDSAAELKPRLISSGPMRGEARSSAFWSDLKGIWNRRPGRVRSTTRSGGNRRAKPAALLSSRERP
jgi:hypothetical protein